MYDRQTLPLASYTSPPVGAPAYAGKTLGELNQYKPVPEDPPLSEEMTRTLIHGYYAALSYMDAQMGRVLDELDQLDLADDTIVAVWGDHGYHLGDHGAWTKHTNYEQANRIPILIAAPGVTQAGESSSALVETVDLYPTLCQLAGLAIPSGPQPMDGKSLVPILTGNAESIRTHAYHCFPKAGKLGRAIRTPRYRLVEWKPFGSDRDPEYELYDYQEDPLETENLAAKQPDVVKELALLLSEHPPAVPPQND